MDAFVNMKKLLKATIGIIKRLNFFKRSFFYVKIIYDREVLKGDKYV